MIEWRLEKAKLFRWTKNDLQRMYPHHFLVIASNLTLAWHWEDLLSVHDRPLHEIHESLRTGW